MSFCTKCGREMADNAVGCPNCAETVAVINNGKRKNKKILFGVIGGAIVVIAIALVLIFILGGNSYDKAVEGYINYYYCGIVNEENVRPLAPESLWDYWAEHEDFKNADEMFENMNDRFDLSLSEYEYRDVDMDFEIKYEEELSRSELDELCERLEENYGTNYSDFSEGYSFEVEINVSITATRDGKPIYKDIIEEENLIAVKLKGEWYLVDSVGSRIWLIDAVM